MDTVKARRKRLGSRFRSEATQKRAGADYRGVG